MAILSSTSTYLNFHFHNSSLSLIYRRPFRLLRPSLRLWKGPDERLRRCLSASPDPPSSLPESDPPPPNDPSRLSGLVGTLSKFQDRVQIFFAVLFWMSLFFWGSAWDGRSGGRPDKGSRSRR
ncbi:hypothetical protein CFOL_v3_30486 [Cephalotus follicularis]|uniref:Uncharacterized protein n=1 Tax=Cephalotus follicularis TaxID=3775 RepID=A0A1Q3D3J4_CEPFO|nr:hypothetical protein CFOL_v3_30486 [Cephalotus follicularis]